MATRKPKKAASKKATRKIATRRPVAKKRPVKKAARKKAAAKKVAGKKAQRKGPAVKKAGAFKLTYATMFNPPEQFHTRYETALAKVKAEMGREHGMLIGGKEVRASERFEDRSPINRDWLLGNFQKGTVEHGRQAIAAARKAFPAWSRLSWKERVRLLRKAADIMDQRIYEFGAVLSLEVGKNRTEALGDAAETADLPMKRHAAGQL